MSDVRRVNVLTRQRLLSDDFNNAGRMVGRVACLAELASALGDEYLASGFGRGGVVGGFLVEAIVGSNRIKVQPGIALVEVVAAAPTFDPPVRWIELGAEVEVDLNASVDGALPRLVTIEIEPVSATLVAGVVDIFDPSTGTFGVDPTAARVVGSSPLITVNAGAPAAAPVVPLGAAGKIPLAVVKLAPAQGAFTDPFASVLMCRPMIQAPGERVVPADYVRGGGVSVGEESGGALVKLTNLYLSKMTCSLRGLEAQVAGLILFPTRGRTPDTTTPAGLLGTRQAVYGWAMPPPWRTSDYGLIAPREAWQRNPNQIAFADVQNVVGGAGSTFVSLAAETATSTGLTHRNAIVVWDSLAPYGLERGAGNAPIQIVDARGPHIEHAPGGSGLNLDPAQDPSWGGDQQASESVYLGSVASLNLAADFMAQASTGHGRIRLLDQYELAGAIKRRPAVVDTTGGGSTDTIYPGNYPDMLVGDARVLPEGVEVVEMWLRWVSGTAAATAVVSLFGPFGYGNNDNPPAVTGGFSRTVNTVDAGSFTLVEPAVFVELGASGECFYVLLGTTNPSVIMMPAAYVDPFIAAR